MSRPTNQSQPTLFARQDTDVHAMVRRAWISGELGNEMEGMVMAAETKIEWTDHSASPWHGCDNAVLPDGTPHPGCEHCYAEAMAKRNTATLGVWGPQGTRIRSKSFIANLRKWNKQAQKAGAVQSVFPSICDPFEQWDGPIMDHEGNRLWVERSNPMGGYIPETPCYDFSSCRPATMNDLRREMFAVADECPWIRLLLLTKRPQNVRKMWTSPNPIGDHPYGSKTVQTPDGKSKVVTLGKFVAEQAIQRGEVKEVAPFRGNVWIGTSISNQQTADAMLPELLKLRDLSPCLFVSAEPLLGPINFTDGPANQDESCMGEWSELDGIDWLIIGGESGPHARPCDVSWIRSLVQQCQAAGVPCFVKQMGERLAVANDSASEWPRHGDEWETVPADYMPRFQGERVTLRMAHKGGEIADWPHDLRVRQFPEVQR